MSTWSGPWGSLVRGESPWWDKTPVEVDAMMRNGA
jgi:hypothetical protein